MTDMELSARFPSLFSPSFLLARNSTPKHRGICSTLLWTPFAPHQSLDSFALHGKGIPCHLLHDHSRRAWPSHCHGTGWERVLDKRDLTTSLSSPVSRRRVELPSGVWNRHICLHQGSCHHFEMLWPSKDTTYSTDETTPQSNDVIFFFFQQIDWKYSLLNSQSQCLYSRLTEGKKI